MTYTKVKVSPDSEEVSQGTRTQGNRNDPSTWVIPVGWQVKVIMGDATIPFTFQVPDHTSDIEQYRGKVMRFKATQNNPISFLGGLVLDDQRATTRGLFVDAQRVARGGKEGRYAWIVSDKHLGQGTFGDVLEVFNTTNWCMCAGKRMKTEVTFQNESRLLKMLSHKHIVQYIDVEEKKPTSPSMIIMEYYPLGDLKAQHKTRTFSEAEIVHIITQISSALAYLHQNKVTHRDLKPANILVRSRNPVEVAVTDFGVSKVEESVMSTYAGTFQYMAPEVVSNNMDTTTGSIPYSNQADIWSLGVVALYLLRGRIPDPGPGSLQDQSYARKINSNRDGLLSVCQNQDLACLVRSMLEWRQLERPTAAECLQRASLLAPPQPQAAGGKAGDTRAGRAKGKDPVRGASGGGGAASTVRVFKREGSDLSTAKPPAKTQCAAGPSTKRDPSRAQESEMLRELEREINKETGSAPKSVGESQRAKAADGTSSKLGSSLWKKLGTAPPTKSLSKPKSGT